MELKCNIAFRLTYDLIKKIKVTAAERDVNANVLAKEAFELWFKDQEEKTKEAK